MLTSSETNLCTKYTGCLAQNSKFVFPKERSSVNSSALEIVGGDEASPNQFPYQVALYIEYDLVSAFCGGSLVSSNYVLTAAHCALGAISFDVILGAHNISDNSEPTRQRSTTSKYVVHPDWNSTSLTNDLALIELETPITLNDFVSVVSLAVGNNSFADSEGTACGWGKTTDSQVGTTDVLRYETSIILSNDDCKNVDSNYEEEIKNTHLCLAGDGIKSICKGDSGGPLVADNVQVGITSFSYRSCEAGKPSVFTRVTEFTQWIQENSDVIFA
uniref:Peptidase S1 domain-containing protein n=1 Tax=Dendroctonus ponderosae TaxID=77166 RepID=A0AAR5PXC5_DENPD